MLSQTFEQKREQTARAAFEAAVGEVDKLRDEMKERNAAYDTKLARMKEAFDTNISQVTADTKTGRFVLYFVAFAMIYLVTVRKH
ncbi:hypothetical protein DFH09DRAFT_1338480 [Mycena vulgaris]|nr:hypothetical protein DFH09DRAFT_1338480 [Mycena vulgaris]